MPTTPKYRMRALRAPPVRAEYWALLNDQPIPPDGNEFAEFTFDAPELWAEHGQTILRDWILKRPGTRPSLWWTLDAPEKQRKRVGGKGTATWEYTPCFVRGLPKRWEAAGFDVANPPRYESQASYLKRHALLAPGESRRLRAADYEPQELPREHWPWQIRRFP